MTNTYNLDLRFHVHGHESIEELEQHLDHIVEHLAELDGPIDPDLTANMSTGDVMFSLGIEAESGPEALRDALVVVRTAIHACDGGTPEWGALFDEIEQTIRPDSVTVNLVDA